MKHFQSLSDADLQHLFFKQPVTFNETSDPDLIAMALGGTLYSPSIRPDLVGDLLKLYQRGVMSSVLCLEDSIPDDRVEEGEQNIVRVLTELDQPKYFGKLPLLFIRIRNPGHLAKVAAQNAAHLDVLTGFVFPKFEDITGAATAYLDVLNVINTDRIAAGKRALYCMPILESPMMAYSESRDAVLSGIQRIVDAQRDSILALRIGATDLSGAYGLRRSAELTIYDVKLISNLIGDIVNRFGRADKTGYIITGCVWEHFNQSDRFLKPQLRESPFAEDRALRKEILTQGLDNFIKEILYDQANGIFGKTVIHPSHVTVVHALSVVSHEEYSDALTILSQEHAAGGATSSTYKNKMNEVKPHTAWAQRTALRADAFGVANQGIDFVDFLEATR